MSSRTCSCEYVIVSQVVKYAVMRYQASNRELGCVLMCRRPSRFRCWVVAVQLAMWRLFVVTNYFPCLIGIANSLCPVLCPPACLAVFRSMSRWVRLRLSPDRSPSHQSCWWSAVFFTSAAGFVDQRDAGRRHLFCRSRLLLPVKATHDATLLLACW